MGKKKEPMTITKALVELKLLDSRINKSVVNPLISLTINNEEVKQRMPVIEAKDFLKSKNDLIENRAKIKMAIMISNLKTKVEIGGTKMSVLEAIERKNTIQYDKTVVFRLTNAVHIAVSAQEEHNGKVERNLAKLLESAASSGALDDQVAADMAKNHREKNLMTLDLGSYDIYKEIKEATESIEEFEAEVDFVLSTSNALTVIEV